MEDPDATDGAGIAMFTLEGVFQRGTRRARARGRIATKPAQTRKHTLVEIHNCKNSTVVPITSDRSNAFEKLSIFSSDTMCARTTQVCL